MKQGTSAQSKVQALEAWVAKDPLALTLLISLVVHVVIIVAVKFEPPDLRKLKDKMPPLEVLLVNAKTLSAPNKADALAQSNLDRGGNTDKDRKMKSALPSPKAKQAETIQKQTADVQLAKKLAEQQAEEEREQKRVEKLEKQSRELMAALQADKKVESSPTQKSSAVDAKKEEQASTSKNVTAEDLLATSLEIARLEALISKQQDDYQKRPKRKFVGARAQEYRFALYVESWRQKVEKIGNLNYPEAARAQKLYGQLRMTVSIKSNGDIEDIVIDKSSGSKILDSAAERIVRMAEPYAAFPEDIKKDTDLLSITRTWTFTREDSLATE